MLSLARNAWKTMSGLAIASLLRSVLAVAAFCPPRVVDVAAKFGGSAFYRAARRRRCIVLRNLDIAFSDALSRDEKRKIARASFSHLVANVLMLGARRQRVTPERLSEFFACSAEEDALLRDLAAEPFAVLASHVGDWEISHHYLALRGIPLQVVARELTNPYLDRMLTELRSTRGAGVIPKRGALRGLLRVLREGRSVGLLADQNCPTRECFLPFFGVPASTYTEYARLLARTGCRVAFFACVRTRGTMQYRLVLRELTAKLPALDNPPARGQVEQRAEEIVSRYLQATEDVVREHPAQYLWLHRRWKSRPDETPWLYHDLGRPLPPAIRREAIESAAPLRREEDYDGSDVSGR